MLGQMLGFPSQVEIRQLLVILSHVMLAVLQCFTEPVSVLSHSCSSYQLLYSACDLSCMCTLKAPCTSDDKSLADKSLADKSLADKSLADKSLADKSLADKSLAALLPCSLPCCRPACGWVGCHASGAAGTISFCTHSHPLSGSWQHLSRWWRWCA
jgi:hypothetical protein